MSINTIPDFSALPEVSSFKALLFDMDGTIIDSTNAIIKHWYRVGQELGVDPEEILKTSHGRRSIDVIRLYKPELATAEYTSRMEGEIPRLYGQDAIEVPGSRDLLASITNAGVPWAIVTSGTLPLVTGWLDVLKLAHPKHLVVAEDVEAGKPDPACYQLGFEKLGLKDDDQSSAVHARDCELPLGHAALVLEDAPAGVRAGKAAGFKVLALATTHSIEQLKTAGADWIVKDLESVKMRRWRANEGVVDVEIRDALRT